MLADVLQAQPGDAVEFCIGWLRSEQQRRRDAGEGGGDGGGDGSGAGGNEAARPPAVASGRGGGDGGAR